jgi:hypothetical protein
MLGFEFVDMIGDVFQAAGDVRRFVVGGREDVVGGNDAATAESDKKQGQNQRALFEEQEDGRVRRWRRRGSRARGRGRNFGGLSGQTGTPGRLAALWV